MSTDYGKTIHLPKTDFPRRAGLAKKEPEILARWEKMDLYKKQRKASEGREKFVLHMGPPFANGHIHMGTALSTLLKDIVTRSYQQLGYDAPLVPGFDCHGLPIEWKVEERYREAGKDKDEVPPVEFREECRQFADKWLKVQSEEFQRLGIHGDWDDPYLTMHKKSEALIAKEIHKFLLNDSLYRGSKPVMWSVPEETALAEAEVEYRDHTSDTVWVKFPVKEGGPAELSDANIVIWTTTPWTLPGNRAVAYGENLDYRGLEVKAVNDDSLARVGDRLVVCDALYDEFVAASGITDTDTFWTGKGGDLAGVVCRHTLHAKGYGFDVPALAADFATADTGTGFVHIAPGHGEDDYKLGMKHGLEVPQTVAGDGSYTDNVPLFAGEFVYTSNGKKGPANKLVMTAIQDEGNLVAKGQITHSYPHSWRSKSPVIFRNTPQWFISMDEGGLRDKAMKEINENVRWVPARGQNRIGSMIEQRGDWCVSRQRAWGVPIAMFVEKKTGEPLRDEAVLDRIIEIFMEEGSDAWFDRPAHDFLGNDYNPDDYEQIKDIIDVWFESGSTHGFVLEQRPELHWPADLYLEGSDQHRGWFQSSLLVACGTRGSAPYKAVLTHGFILDEKGYKMSKSIGNVTSPMELSETYGADIVRLWVVGSDYTDDIKFGKNILQGHVDIYRRIRNTFCYLLGNLADFGEADPVELNKLSDYDRWVLHRLYEIDATVRRCVHDFDFQEMITALHNFCTRDLSAYYFDVNKDNLYCNATDSVERRATQTVLEHVFTHLCHWLSPILCYTAEEAWLSRKGLDFSDLEESIHLGVMPDVPAEWRDDALAEKWDKIHTVRRVVTGAIEIKRAEKEVRASLEASPKVYIADADLRAVIEGVDFHDICITSDIEIVAGDAPDGAFTLEDVTGVGVVVETSGGDKCARCWKYTDDVGSDPDHAEICARCAEVVGTLSEAA